ncbi:MAG: 30S ribosomal protein S7 [bacterium]|uniref:Small ribosomal subunit protein uS7 n=1 Tax=Candidatus Acididesulfobacter diazotrophicus TaxID=2597226 RepID=A0A519BQ65_9DELT|nr:30S ribosomal protein S7 [Deltaproteobacteria bacterium]RZD19404.1 MAG: 30S ribosomal protein S7 [Candidatus Acididesulfobacter diazotrophicus]
MSRRKRAVKRVIEGDPKFNDKVVQKFINKIMYDGKKSIAEGLFYRSLEIIQEKTKEDGFKMFKQAIDNAKPVLEVKARRVGGSNYQVPIEVRSDRKLYLAIRWIVTYARMRNEKSMEENLALEILDAANNKGGSIKKKEDTFKMAEANKAFAHFRW